MSVTSGAVPGTPRRASGPTHARLTQVLRQDLFDYRAIEAELSHFDAGFYNIRVGSAGMGDAHYSELAHDMPRAVDHTLAWRGVPGTAPEATDISALGRAA